MASLACYVAVVHRKKDLGTDAHQRMRSDVTLYLGMNVRACLVNILIFFIKKSYIYDVLNEIYLQNFSQIGANLRAKSNEPNLIMTRYNNDIVTIL